MRDRSRPQGLYAITDTRLCSKTGISNSVNQALAGGARWIQYRDKTSSRALRQKQASQLTTLCRQYGARLIINDDFRLAAEVEADGVHLGKDDAPISQARRTLGDNAIIGISCYNDLKRVQAAEDAGAGYIALGSFFSSSTKPDADHASPELLSQARAMTRLPLVAIGGINPNNGARLIESGADMLAVISAIFDSPDICAASTQFTKLWNQ